MMEKRYQVFVSSTYEDLKKERQEVIQSLLEFDCIPVGMEFFPAADESAWEVIKRVIEECDYYVVIVAGRYGSLSPEGISYTQKEYKYAIEQSLPVAAFLHGDTGKIPAEKTETSEESRKKLEEFRDLCKAHKLCKYWKTPDELAGAVVKSLNQLRKTHPRIGWVRADQVPEESSPKEILKLKGRIEELEAEREELRTTAPVGTDDLAQGDNEFTVQFRINVQNEDFEYVDLEYEIRSTWNAIFNAVGPLMIYEASEWDLKHRMLEILKPVELGEFKRMHQQIRHIQSINVLDDTLHTIIIQLRSLGLIVQSIRQRSIKDTSIYWKLTPYGDNLITKMRAIMRTNQ
jgi:hypothetical protein